MNGTRLYAVVACATSLGCSSPEAPAPAANDDAGNTTETTSSLDSGTLPFDAPAADDTSVTADTSTPKKSAYLRIFDGLDGAAIYVCSKGSKLGGNYDRTGAGGSIASGYMETTTYGSFRAHAQATTAPSCLSDSSSDPSYSLSEGVAKTLFVRAITGPNGILSVTDDLSPPAPGKSRVRVYSGATAFATANGFLDVCVGGAAWATGLAGAAGGSYQEVTPGGASVEIRKAATPACSGATLATISVTTTTDATHTLFLVDGKGGAKNHASLCIDAIAGVPATSGNCTDTAF